jgi:hypothetical protein
MKIFRPYLAQFEQNIEKEEILWVI